MHRTQPIANRLYAYLYPSPTASDPTTFANHLAKYLVPEVRIEVATFYGDLNSTEARYPGLNYCHAPHRLRLGRFRHHRKLFDAFDALELTYNEIQDFCCWEGTKWARERYEKDEGIKVLDTTGNGIKAFVDRRSRGKKEETRRDSITRKTEIEVVIERPSSTDTVRAARTDEMQIDDDLYDSEDEEDDGEDGIENEDIDVNRTRVAVVDGPIMTTFAALPAPIPSISHSRSSSANFRNAFGENSINQQILQALERGQALPADIEQYLKEQRERGLLAPAPLTQAQQHSLHRLVDQPTRLPGLQSVLRPTY